MICLWLVFLLQAKFESIFGGTFSYILVADLRTYLRFDEFGWKFDAPLGDVSGFALNRLCVCSFWGRCLHVCPHFKSPATSRFDLDWRFSHSHRRRCLQFLHLFSPNWFIANTERLRKMASTCRREIPSSTKVADIMCHNRY